MDALFTVENMVALLTLTALEIVLGIDNIVFISILSSKLPESQRARARTIGLLVALLGRVVLLFSISWVMSLQSELFSAFGHGLSGRDLILIGGGLFLIAKATFEIHARLEGEHTGHGSAASVSFGVIVAQIVVLDIVFSLDSVITAVGMSNVIPIMVTAVVVAIIVMIVFAGRISTFIERHPTIKMLALAFLLLIGVMLVVEGFDQHVDKGYIYFAMAFSLFVELLNLRLIAKRDPPRPLGGPKMPDDEVPPADPAR